jgi:hypothetical protein
VGAALDSPSGRQPAANGGEFDLGQTVLEEEAGHRRCIDPAVASAASATLATAVSSR